MATVSPSIATKALPQSLSAPSIDKISLSGTYGAGIFVPGIMAPGFFSHSVTHPGLRRSFVRAKLGAQVGASPVGNFSP